MGIMGKTPQTRYDPTTIEGEIDALSQKKIKSQYFAVIGAGTESGTISKPAGGGADVSFVMDEWGTSTDALLSTIENGKPTFITPVDSLGSSITTTFNTDGDFAFSGTPDPANDIALIYVYVCNLENYDFTETLFESELLTTGGITNHNDLNAIQGGAAGEYYHLTSAELTKLGGIEALADVTSTHETSHADVVVDGDIGSTVCSQTDARLSDARVPTAHAASHVDGSDDIQNATNAQKGLATAAHIQAIEANTEKNTNVPTALSMGTVGVETIAITSDGGADDVTLPMATNAAAGVASAAQITKLEGIEAGADVTSIHETSHATVVTATSVLTDNALIRGDGGTRGAQTTTVLVDDSNRMTNANQPMVLEQLSGTQSDVTGDGTAFTLTGAIWTEIVDQGNNSSNGTFTAPITGKYQVNLIMNYGGITSSHDYGYVRITTSNRSYYKYYNPYLSAAYNGYGSYGIPMTVDMDLNDTLTVGFGVDRGAKVVDLTADTFVSITLLT